MSSSRTAYCPTGSWLSLWLGVWGGGGCRGKHMGQGEASDGGVWLVSDSGVGETEPPATAVRARRCLRAPDLVRCAWERARPCPLNPPLRNPGVQHL